MTNAFGPARLFHNRGDGTFEETTASSGIAVPGNARSAAFADVDGDGDLDLFVGVTGDYYTQMPDPAFDANDGRQNFLYLNDGHGHFTDATKAWGLAGMTRWTLSSPLPGLRPGRPRGPDGDQRLRPEEPVPQRGRQALRGRREEDRHAGARVRHVRHLGRLRRRRPARPLHDRHRHAVVLPPRVPGDPGRPLPAGSSCPFAIQWCEDMASGNTLLLQRPDHTFENATARSGAQHAGWNWSSIAADLDDDGWPDIYATNGMWGDGRDRDVELEFWWQTLAYWDDYVAGTRTFDRKGAGINGIERDRYFHNRGGAAAGAPALRGPRVSRRPRPRDERPRRRRLRRQRRRRARPLRPLGRGAGGPLPRAPAARTSTTCASASPAPPARTTATASAPASRRSSPGGRTIVTENANASGYLSTGSPIVHLGLGKADAAGRPHRPLALGQGPGRSARSTPWTGRSSWTRSAVSRYFGARPQ